MGLDGLTPTLTMGQWRREARANFFAFTDFSLQWHSWGEHVLQDDATLVLVDTIANYLHWNTSTVMMPRGMGKTTIICLAMIWMTWRHPWLQSMFLTAVPDVKRDAFIFSGEVLSHHPLLRDIRPVKRPNEQWFSIDLPTRRSKGTSFRYRTVKGSVTGGRAHLNCHDDQEVPATVTTATQRRKIREARSEATNLHFKGHWFAKDLTVGTPWAKQSMLREGTPDVHIEIPASIFDEESGVVELPYLRLQERELDQLRDTLIQWMLDRQYYFETDEDRTSFPVRAEWLRFREFDWQGLTSRMIIMDPAGGAETMEERRLISEGIITGDGMTALAVGVRHGQLRVLDMYSEPCDPDAYLSAVEDMCSLYRISDIAVEKNFGSWGTSARLWFERKQRVVRILTFHTSANKLRKVLAKCVPAMAQGAVVFHARLRDRAEIVDPDESQFLNLRWDELPRPDDVIDTVAMAIEQLEDELYIEWPGEPDIDARMRHVHAPPLARHAERVRRERAASASLAVESEGYPGQIITSTGDW